MNPIFDEHTLVVVITQSCETADSLAALRLANERGAKTISIVNVKGSSIARESDYVLYTHAGPEIAVASTKAFSVQCAGMYLIALKLAEEGAKVVVADMAPSDNAVKEIEQAGGEAASFCVNVAKQEEV